MAKRKFKLTRLEMKRQRDLSARFSRFLPTLKLKQQQLQVTLIEVRAQRDQLQADVEHAESQFKPYAAVLNDLAGVNVRQLAQPLEVLTGITNIAGVNVPVFNDVKFAEARYSLFATPAWVDQALADLRNICRRREEMGVLDRQFVLLSRELTKIMQRVNLFEKVKIPEARDAIRRIRIQLGDEQTAAVARAKIAKVKLALVEAAGHKSSRPPQELETQEAQP